MKITYKIPENKSDITTEVYIALTNLYKLAEENETEVNDFELVSTCLKLPINIVKQLPNDDYNSALDSIKKALNTESEFSLTFKHKGIKYGFITDLENMTIGEFSALDNLLSDPVKNYLNILNVLYRPIVKEKTFKSWFSKDEINKYTIKNYDPDYNLELLKGLPCDIFDSSLVFFYRLRTTLQAAILKSTAVEVENMTKGVQTLVRNGDGIKPLTHTLLQSAYDLKKSTPNLLIKYSLD